MYIITVNCEAKSPQALIGYFELYEDHYHLNKLPATLPDSSNKASPFKDGFLSDNISYLFGHLALNLLL